MKWILCVGSSNDFLFIDTFGACLVYGISTFDEIERWGRWRVSAPGHGGGPAVNSGAKSRALHGHFASHIRESRDG